uniref:U5 small nuclear ribonucleoprotein 40 kDa protein n=1 Tax=Meloidogyne incognita TaxID=6306 RepID=A0A914MR55_MELIC
MAESQVFRRPALPLAPRDVKRPRLDEGALVPVEGTRKEENGNQRPSSLQSPIMLLTGHEGEIFGARFSHDGNILASVGFDMKIFLWNARGECENFSTITGHKGAIMDVHFNTDTSYLYTCSTDKTVRVWDMETGVCVRRFRSHSDFVNGCHPARRGPDIVCSGSDDGTIQVHDLRKRKPAIIFENINKYQVTTVTFNDTAELVLSGGIDNALRVWDIRKNSLLHSMHGHSDTVTGLCLSPDGSFVLSNAMDCTARIWDIRPYSTSQRCVKTLSGHQHNFEKNLLRCAWSPDSHRVSCGSSDRFVYVWDVGSRNIAYKLPGHQGSVNAVDFHPTEPIILSAGSDKRIFLGELTR